MTLHPDQEAWATMSVQQAMAVLMDHHAREWNTEAHEAAKAQRVADWLAHAEACERRADEYLANAGALPKAHRDHAYFLRLANEQLGKAADGRRYAETERNRL